MLLAAPIASTYSDDTSGHAIETPGFARGWSDNWPFYLNWRPRRDSAYFSDSLTTITDPIMLSMGGRIPTRSKSQITTDVGRRLHGNRPPTHPGEMFLEEFIKPLDLTQTELAHLLDVSYPRLNVIIKSRRSVTPDTALRLSRVLGMSADFRLGLQQDWNLWQARNSPGAKQINELKPLSRARHTLTTKRST